MSMQNLSWLLIGMGVGICLGRDELGIFIFGILLLCTGFILNYFCEQERLESEKIKAMASKSKDGFEKPKGLNTRKNLKR